MDKNTTTMNPSFQPQRQKHKNGSPPPSPARKTPCRGEGVPQPRSKDIALGRGGMANNHAGNKSYREIVDMYKIAYLDTKTHKEKGAVVRQVFLTLQNEGYRFVYKENGLWYEAPYHKARLKVVQGLREKAPELRKAIESISILNGACIVEEVAAKGCESMAFSRDGTSRVSSGERQGFECFRDVSTSSITSSQEGTERIYDEEGDEDDTELDSERLVQNWDPLPLVATGDEVDNKLFAGEVDEAAESILSKLLRLDV